MDSDQIQTHLLNQIQTFQQQQPQGIFNLAAPNNMETFFTTTKHGNINQTVIPSSSKQIGFYNHGDNDDDDDDDGGGDDHLMDTVVADHHHDNSASWHHENNSIVDDSSLRCVFTCEGNERPSQGLSLSLSSTNPSSIGLQSFELRQHQQNHHPMLLQDQHQQQQHAFRHDSRDGFYGKSINMIQNHQHQHHREEQMGQFQLRNSKFLGPAQELLNEFCYLGTKQNDIPNKPSNNPLIIKNNQWEDEHTSIKKQNLLLNSHELIELQKRKAKLLSMLEEVDKRYKHYCDQMKAVVSSFEAVAGYGAAKVYSALASKAMSRHFRCLRDGIVSQIQESSKAMGEKDTSVGVAPGTTKGETPRLRLLDQTLRQQRAMQQMSLMESHPWRPQRGLPERSVSVLRAWLFEHFLHPYPSDVDKHILARQTGLSRSQVSNWFINARVRLWKPMVEEMYVEETKEHLPNNNNNAGSLDLPTNLMTDDFQPCQNLNNDQKPTPDQLVRIDSECLSSIISTNPDPKNDSKTNTTLQQHQNQISFGRVMTDTYIGGMELDFSSYNHHSSSNAVGYDGGTSGGSHHHFGGTGARGGVSLTLGLQQHGGSSFVGLGSHEESMFYTRDHHNIIDDCTQTVPYSILDGEAQNLPYRNLLGAQLLHDLAG